MCIAAEQHMEFLGASVQTAGLPMEMALEELTNYIKEENESSAGSLHFLRYISSWRKERLRDVQCFNKYPRLWR